MSPLVSQSTPVCPSEKTRTAERIEPTNRAQITSLVIVVTVGLVLRVFFAVLVLRQHTSESFLDIHGDTFGYVRLGERLYECREYTAADAVHRNRGLIRPPGYPALLAATRLIYGWMGVDLSADLRQIVWMQIPISLAGIVATYGIAYVTLRSRIAATIAASLAALSPTGIAAAAIALPDSTFSAAFGAAFLGFLIAANPLATRVAARHRATVTALAGLALAIATLLKPACIYWPVAALPALLFCRGLRWSTLGDARRLFLPTLIVVVFWTAFNAQTSGVWAYSIVFERNLRYDVVPKAELFDRLGRMPTQAEYTKYASGATRREKAYLESADASVAKLHGRVVQRVKDAVLAHPIATLRVCLSNLRSQLTSRYKMIRRQLPDGRGLSWNRCGECSMPPLYVPRCGFGMAR